MCLTGTFGFIHISVCVGPKSMFARFRYEAINKHLTLFV